MADIDHFVLAEIPADRSRGRCFGVGGAEQVADAGDYIIAFEGERDHGRFLHEAADGGEERLVGDVRVMLGEDFVTEGHHLDATHEEAFLLETGKHLAGEVFRDSVGFEENQCSFKSHGL